MTHIPFFLPGFEIQHVTLVERTLTVMAVATSKSASCPSCGEASRRIHSYYLRKPWDVSSSGFAVQLHLHVRRFRCQNEACARQTFSERLPEIVAVRAQRTVRLSALLSVFAVALSGQLASRLLNQFGMKTCADTLLRLVKRGMLPEAAEDPLL